MLVRRVVLALLVLTAPALASETDCAALERPGTAFQITYDVGPARSGESSRSTIDQYQHREDGTGRMLRREAGRAGYEVAATRNGLVTLWSRGSERQETLVEYDYDGLDPAVDPFTRPVDFSFRVRTRLPGASEFTTRETLSFQGEDTVSVSGCAFRVLRWHWVSQDMAGGSLETTELWYAPVLHAYLRLEARTAGGAAQALIATRVDTRFQPFDMN